MKESVLIILKNGTKNEIDYKKTNIRSSKKGKKKLIKKKNIKRRPKKEE